MTAFPGLQYHSERSNVIQGMFVFILGFVIGKRIAAPEVYNPGGLTVMIDDFCVQSENLWQSVGAKLIEEIKAAAKVKGATQILVVCGSHDNPKRKFLSEQNLSIASEWFVGGIV